MTGGVPVEVGVLGPEPPPPPHAASPNVASSVRARCAIRGETDFMMIDRKFCRG
jgi:hypothetical protein